ncbi:MAG: hypothetical protein PSY14_10055 [bacterium]|nr:hypothetical protein [bacterium]
MTTAETQGKGGYFFPAFLIVLATGLFALLAYIVINTAIIENTGAAGERKDAFKALIKFPDETRRAVNVMLKSGVDVAKLNFAEKATGTNAVFDKVTYESPPAASGIGANWNFRGRSADGSGWFVSGIGSDEAGGADVFGYLTGLTQSDCEDINEALGLNEIPAIEKTTVNLGKKSKAKAVAGDNGWSFNARAALTPPDPKPAACVQNGKNAKGEPLYIYYHVIVAK